MQQQHILQRQETMRAFRGGQGHEARDLCGNRQQRAQGPLVTAALQLQRKAEAGVRDERKGVRRVDGQRRQHGKDVVEKDRLERGAIFLRQGVAVQDGDPLGLHLAAQFVEDGLLALHQVARILVDQHQLFGRCQPVRGGCDVSGMGQFPQARHAHRVEFVKIGRRNRQKAKALQQRHTGILGLFQHAPVETQPAEFAVVEAARPGQVQILDRQRGVEWRRKEICMCHERLMLPDCDGLITDAARGRTNCPAGPVA